MLVTKYTYMYIELSFAYYYYIIIYNNKIGYGAGITYYIKKTYKCMRLNCLVLSSDLPHFYSLIFYCKNRGLGILDISNK